MATQDQIDRMAHHLSYEFAMLAYSAYALAAQQPPGSNEIARTIINALLESFLIHARSLIDFLFDNAGTGKRGKGKPHLCARDFMTHLTREEKSQWKRQRGMRGPKEHWDKISHQISVEIAHLSMERLNGKTGWHHTLVLEIRDLMKAFSTSTKGSFPKNEVLFKRSLQVIEDTPPAF